MSKITKLDNGKYLAQVYDENGKRHRITFDKKAEADMYLNKIETPKIERKLLRRNIRKTRVTFEQALLEFKSTKDGLRDKSRAKYYHVVDQLKGFIDSQGLKYLDEFTPDHGTILYEELKKERIYNRGNKQVALKPKPKTVNFYLQTIRAFFREEVVKGHLIKSPLLHIKNLKVEKKHPDYYTTDELDKFFAHDMPEYLRNSFLGLRHTGMRFGELANLTWNDIDLLKKLIHVRSKGNFQAKTFNSERTIPMNATMVNLLTSLAVSKQSTYVFCSKTGAKLSERRLLDECKKIAKAAGITSRVFLHKFRHTFASHLIQKGIRIEVIQKLLGHASINETMIYAHLKSDNLHEEISVLDDPS